MLRPSTRSETPLSLFKRLSLAAATVGIIVTPTGAPGQATPDTAKRPGGATTTLPLSYPRSAKFTTTEGTWMSLDVSPDGKTIVFDLLGDLYTLPIDGGKATRITDGPGFDAQPRFNRAGTKIVFQSDRNGSENLYTVSPDGSNVEAITTGANLEYVSPTWSPDGQFIVVSRSKYNVENYDLYLYRSEKSDGLKLNGDPQRGGGMPGRGFLGATFGPTNRHLYYSVGASWGYNFQSFPNSIQRYDFETGEVTQMAQASGGAFRPMVSPDGKWLVYATRRDTSTSFRIQNLETREETWLIDNVQRDDQESCFTRDLMPGSAFTPDGKAIITAYDGTFWRVEIPSGKATRIAFSADVDLQLGELVRFEYPINDSTLTATQIQHPRLSPDGKRVTFTSLNRVWVMDLPNGTPTRLTDGAETASGPVWSPDGRWIAYATWNDSTGHVYRLRSDGTGTPERLTKKGARYGGLGYSPNGSRLLVSSSSPNESQFRRDRLGWLPASGGEITPILEQSPGQGYFVKGDSTRIYVGMASFRWDGFDQKSHLRSAATSFSPDGERVVFNRDNDLAIARVPFTRDVQVNLLEQGSPLLGRKVGALKPEFVSWSDDGRKLVWSAGRFLFLYDVPTADSLVADSVAKAKAKAATKDTAKADSAKKDSTTQPAKPKPIYAAERIEVKVVLPKDKPTGVLALTNARLITMNGDEVIERGDVVITNNRITAVGRSGDVAIPAGATVMDLRGKTIMPGMVDVHAHPRRGGVQPWAYAAALAYGVTTSRDPQTGGTDVLHYQDMVEIGDVVGPRIYSTGPGIFEGADYSTLDKTREVLRPYSELWFTQTLKQYLVGDRKARQHVLMAAKEQRITPTLEGGLDFKQNVTEAIDGFAGSEHSYPITPLFEDIVQLVAKSGITYTPTLLVAYGGPWSENFMYEKYFTMHDDAKLQRFVPHWEIDARMLRRQNWFADNLYPHVRLSAQAAKIVKAGGKVALGGHGQFSGLGDQFELWLLQSGGMRPIDALRCATLNGAESIGLAKDIGSITVGKLADLVILDKNPLDDIQNTLAIRYVVKNGRVYDDDTLDEVWPRRITRKPFPWLSGEIPQPIGADDPDRDIGK